MSPRRLADTATLGISQALHRVHARFPVLKEWPGLKPLASGVASRVLRPGLDAAAWQVALLHRRRLQDTIFVGVTGSAGKTTTKFMIGAVLSATRQGRYTKGTRNNTRSAARSLLKHARRGDGFHVVELSAGKPGALDHQLQLVKPLVGVVTNIGSDHYQAYGSVDGIAKEKGKLPRSLPPDGVAILNADDARVLAMHEGLRCRVITFGTSDKAMVRGRNISAVWPEPLTFDVVHDMETVQVRTQLHGTLWVHAALAAISTGIALGVPLEQAARAIGDVAPNPGRMSPVTLPDGVSFIRDDWKASVHTIPQALEFLGHARAPRKVAVIGTISDTMGTPGTTYVNTARHALDVADVVCFVGPRAFAAMRAKPADQPDRLRAFGGAGAANQFLKEFLRPDDLVLLKGSNPSDHLYRLILSRTRPVECWRMDCKRTKSCDNCELIEVPSRTAASPVVEADGADDAAGNAAPGVERFAAGQVPTIVVGLGNPGAHRDNTPHNVGYAVLDRLAEAAGATWRDEAGARVATLDWNGEPIWLLKPGVVMNTSGPAIYALARQRGFAAEDCILVYDDLDLPLGAARTRMRGSDGGHRGVRSILEAFQTDQFRRVKVGVKRAGDAAGAKEAVLAAFSEDDQPLLRTALDAAGKQLMDLVLLQARARAKAIASATAASTVPASN
jgi:aminoacyl-tRNA hydrolase